MVLEPGTKQSIIWRWLLLSAQQHGINVYRYRSRTKNVGGHTQSYMAYKTRMPYRGQLSRCIPAVVSSAPRDAGHQNASHNWRTRFTASLAVSCYCLAVPTKRLCEKKSYVS